MSGNEVIQHIKTGLVCLDPAPTPTLNEVCLCWVRESPPRFSWANVKTDPEILSGSAAERLQQKNSWGDFWFGVKDFCCLTYTTIKTQSTLYSTRTTPHCFYIFRRFVICSGSFSCPFTSASSFHSVFVLLLDSLHLDATQILLCNLDSVQLHSQSPIKAKCLSLSLLFCPPEPKSNISTGTCKRNCPCGKMSKPPIVGLLLPLPHDTTSLSVCHIYLGVQIFPRLYCVTSLGQLTVKNDSVLRKGEYHSKNATTVEHS